MPHLVNDGRRARMRRFDANRFRVELPSGQLAGLGDIGQGFTRKGRDVINALNVWRNALVFFREEVEQGRATQAQFNAFVSVARPEVQELADKLKILGEGLAQVDAALAEFEAGAGEGLAFIVSGTAAAIALGIAGVTVLGGFIANALTTGPSDARIAEANAAKAAAENGLRLQNEIPKSSTEKLLDSIVTGAINIALIVAIGFVVFRFGRPLLDRAVKFVFPKKTRKELSFNG